jgi:hypothetical protein
MHHEQIARSNAEATQVSGDGLDGPRIRLHSDHSVAIGVYMMAE